MMENSEPYPTARGVESAIKEAAKKAAQADPSLDVNKRIRLEYFNCFLSRVFSEGDESEWVLKGGAGMLARIPSTRSTRDIDLYREGFLSSRRWAISGVSRRLISVITSGSSTPVTSHPSQPMRSHTPISYTLKVST